MLPANTLPGGRRHVAAALSRQEITNEKLGRLLMVDLRKAAMSLLGCALERLPFPRSLATNSWNTGIPESEAERTQRLARKRADLASDLARMDGIEASQVYDGLQDRPAVAPPRPIYRHGKQGFVDKLAMVARAGDGGNGCVSFVSKYRIPDGGNGGMGGSVVLRASEQVRSLAGIQVIQRAEHGKQGRPQNRTGAPGASRVVGVPVGTIISTEIISAPDYENLSHGNVAGRTFGPSLGGQVADYHDCKDDGGDEVLVKFRVLADLVRDGDEVVVAKGGAGGIGNAAISRHRPGKARLEAEAWQQAQHPGKPGEEVRLLLEMKVLAQVGLVGMPNAGKSTLLHAISAARPEIGAYPFTTLTPQLGRAQYKDGSSTTVADIPGLIEGAHENRGLGHAFLRHIERTDVLVYVVDATLGSRDMGGLTPVEQLELLRQELRHYDPTLLAKPSLVAANKMDAATEESQKLVASLRESTPWDVIEISGLKKQGMDQLMAHVRKLSPTDMD